MTPSTPSRRGRVWLVAAAVTVGAIVAAAAVAPIVTGTQARERLEEITSRASAGVAALDWRVTSFEQGAYSSRATSRLEWRFPESDRDPVRIRLRHRIDHGPRVSGWYWARVKTVPVLTGTLAKRIGAAYGDRDPVTAVFVRRLGGERQLMLRSPPAEVRGEDSAVSRWTSQGLDFVARWDNSGRVQIEGAAPGLKLRSRQGHVGLDGLRVTGDLERSDGLWIGRLELVLASLSAQPPAEADGPSGLRVDELKISQSAQRKGGAVAATFDLRAAAFAVPTGRYRNLRGRFQVNGVPAQLVRRVNRAARQARATGAAPLPAITRALRDYGPGKAMAHNPAVRLDALSVETPRGTFYIDARLDFARANGASQRGWLQLLTRLQARTRLNLPWEVAVDVGKAYLERQAQRQDGNGPNAAQIEASVRRQLAGFVQRGWVERRDGQLVTEIGYAGGMIRINGELAWNLGPMLGR